MGTEVAETLAQADAQAEKALQCGDWSCSASDIPPLVAVDHEVRVSAEGGEPKAVDRTRTLKVEFSVETEVVESEIGPETEVVETEIAAETEVVETEIAAEKGVSEGDALLVEKASDIGEISDSEHLGDVVENGDGPEEVKCLVVDGDSEVPVGVDSDSKVDLEANEISLVVEFHRADNSGENCGKDGDKGSVAENGGAIEEKLTEPQVTDGDMTGDEHCKQKDTCNEDWDKGSVAENEGGEEEKLAEPQGTEGDMDGENGEVTDGGHNKKKDTCNGDGDKGSFAEDGGAEEEKLAEPQGTEGGMGQGLGEDDDSEDGESDAEHDYRVGDFVWGKIRSYPWWPGRIYDPSDASEYAKKLSKSKGLLVAYFGDGSFSWCYPSQLKPFADGFDETSKQSNSKNFVNAIKAALDEIRTATELKMICSCVPEKDRNGLVRPSVVNAGIKPGVLVPECDLSRLTGPQNESARVVAALKSVAETGRLTNTLEFAVLKGWLSAFCRAKGGYERAIYREPLYIEGLEEKNRDVVATNLTDFGAPLEVPFQGPSEEDWLFSPLRDGSGQSVLQRCHIADDKLYHRRKKSVADLMNEETVVEPKTKKGKVDATRDSTGSDTLVSVSGRKRGRKKPDTLETSKSGEKTVVSKENGGDEPTSPSRRKRVKKIAEVSEISKSNENRVVSSENGGSGEETKREKVSSVEDGNEETKGVSGSRERKKSKYLSPPFTNTILAGRKTSSKKQHESESEKIRKAARMGERMTKIAGQLFGSTPSAQGSDESQEKQLGTPIDPSTNPTSPPPEENHAIVDSVKNKSMKEVVTELRAAALNPVFGLDGSDGKFIHAFRSSVYSHGSNYKKCLDDQEGEKSKSLSSKSELPEADSEKNEEKGSGNKKHKSRSSKPELQEKDLNLTEPELLEPETPKASNDNNELMKSSKRKRTNRAGKASNEEKDGEKNPKSGNSKPEVVEKDLNRTEHASDSKNGPVKSGKKRAKEAGEASKAKKIAEDMGGEAFPPPALVVAFPPAFSLPSKDDVIRIFSKFGPLNEKETNVLYNSFCARVVFLKTSDAEEACNTSAEKKLFGAANVKYRLQYPRGASNANQKTSPIKTKTPVKPAAAADEVVPPLVFVKEKLELMTSILAKSEESIITPELKSNLEGEMGGLLEMVSAAIKSSSS